jgi:hypothetical protein
MRRLIYASQWTDLVRADSALALQKIVATSIQNNRASNLTGFLVTYDGVFLQVLEGPDAEIAETYERIKLDPRHEQLTVISDATAQARAFKDWNMCGVTIAAGDPIVVESGLGELGKDGGYDAEATLEALQAVAAAEAMRERTAAVGAWLDA